MKRVLTCDDVFERLTRGPFPSGQLDDEQVEQHLDACHECRQLAEALRPAVSLLCEAMASGESLDRSLPVYRGRIAAVANGRTGGRPGGMERVERSANAAWWVVAAALIAGIVVSAMLDDQLSSAQGRGNLPQVRLASNGDQQTADERVEPAARQKGLSVSPDALLAPCCPSPRQIVKSSGIAAGDCCTHCHAARTSQPSQVAQRLQVPMTQLLAACLACHEG